jgi:hypothetical protein
LAANQPGRLYHKIHRASRDLPAHAGACFLGGGSGVSLAMFFPAKKERPRLRPRLVTRITGAADDPRQP